MDESKAGNLPATLTSFVGREREIAQLCELLSGHVRLLTLTGAGGIGKTRLALEVGARMRQTRTFGHGVWLVELAALSDPGAVAQAVGGVLRLQEEPERDFLQVLVDALSSRHILVVLDNCEHLVEACAKLTYTILRACPDVTVLATSREPLGIDGETTHRVPSLGRPDRDHLPPVAELRTFPAVQLFAERATAASTDFRVADDNVASVVRVCDRLDGIPLALELAAARVRVLSVEQIANRLEDRFEFLTGRNRAAPRRQQTLEATVAWSYDLLQEDERQLLRRLSVFSGGWGLEDAEAVCGPIVGVFETHSRLIEKSLVLVEDGPRGERWYRLLVTIRQFALERLSATGEQSAVRDRHLRWYLELAEQFDREVRWHRGNSWATRIGWVDRAVWEYPNLRAAWQWALAGDTASVEAGLRIAAALYGFFYTAGYLSDARAWFATLLARDRDREPTRARARALSVAAKLAVQHGRDADALALALEYFSLPEHLKEPPVTGLAMNARSVVALREGDLATARRYVMAAYEQASIAPEAALSLYLPYVAAVAEAEGNLQEAERTYRLALEQGRADDFLLSVAFALTGLARLAHARGDLGGARALYEEALKSLAEMRGLPQMALTQSALGLLSLEQGDRAAACRTLVPSLQLAMRLGHREALVVALEASAALLADASADQSLALRLAGAVQRLRDGARVQPAPAFVDEALGRARTTIDEPRASLLMSDGRGLSGDAAVNLALAALEACATHPLSAPGVTAREREVAVLLARGRSNREIAEALVIGQRTAEMHVSNLLTKLGMSSRSQVAIWAMQNGLLSEVP